MAEGEPSPSRGRMLRIAAALAAVAAVAGALKLGGASDDGEEPADPAPLAAPEANPPTPIPGPFSRTVQVGGSPGAVAADRDTVVITDAVAPAATLIDSGGLKPEPVPLEEPPTTAAVAAEDIWFGLPESRGVERRSIAEPQTNGETIELDAIPTAIAADAGGAWVLTESAVQRVEPGADDAVDSFGAGGFATAFAVDDDSIWVVADNREVRRFDASSLEPAEVVAEVPDATAIAIGEGYAWVLSATGELTRLDQDSLRRVGEPTRIQGALALAVGEHAVWVSAADGTVTRIDPTSAEAIGRRVRVGDDPAAIAAGAGAVWVAGAGDGTVTRVKP